MIRLSVWLVAAWMCLTLAQAQYSGNVRTLSFTLTSDTTALDSLIILKGTVKASTSAGLLLENIDYKIDYFRSTFIALRIPRNEQISIRYNVMMLMLGKEIRHKDRKIVQPYFQEIRNPYLYPTEKKGSELYQSDGLKMNGSLSRGLSFGNNQDVVVNSNLNLQLAGKLGNDIDVLAAISDENNPVQPEGNTQQLQDFDKVYIQLSKNRTKLTVGDFEMTRPQDSYFMNYNKKSRGIQLYSAAPFKTGTFRFGGEGALSRGRFARNIINGIEGNLGPYRLSGTNGELYIIIISGTEAVYLDGEKLRRGEQYDYVIDYNTGEVTFMPKRVITQYSRIVVEFQYSDRNYARSVFHLNSEYENRNYKIRANYFIEQDSKNQPFLQNLTDSNKALLASVGDAVNNAVAPTAIETREFSSKKILYRKSDTAGYTGVFSYIDVPGADSVFYEVRFSFVGQGNGDYVQAQSSANGRIFQWIAPVAGVKQGSYAPVTLLISPKSLQMYSLGVDVNVIRNTRISVEVARSVYDKNLFAVTDKENDAGYGTKVVIINTTPLQKSVSDHPWKIKTEAQYEFVDENFRYVERYRNVEFDRTWNRQLTNQPAADTGYREHILSLRTSLDKSSVGSTYYQVGYYDRAGLFNGLQQLTGTSLTFSRNILSAEAEWIDTRNQSTATTLVNNVKRYKADYARQLFFLTSGVRFEHEESNYRRSEDSLEQGTFSYNQLTFYTKNSDSTNLSYGVQYAQREDFQPKGNSYQSASLSRTVTANMEYTQKNFNRLSANFTYRDFEVHDTNFVKLKPERTVLSRIEYDYAFLKRVFTANTYYQLGSGQELRRDFQFIEVPAGQGIYVWKDFNNDGVQGLNEFVAASFSDRNQANYIKVFLPTNTTIRTNSNQFNQTLNINPNAVWNNRRGLKKFAARWNNQTALRIDRKTTELSAIDFVNPFMLKVSDSTLIAVSSLIRNTLFFNRADPTFGFDLNYQDNKSKTYLTNGFDIRARQEQGMNTRWNFSTMLGITVGYTNGNRQYTSDFFTANNYQYTFNEIKPRLIVQISGNLRTTLLYTYFEGQNRADLGKQKGRNQEFGAELRYNVGKQGVLNGKFSLFKVTFDGDISSPLGYDMLQGLTTGNNMIWNIGYQQRLSNNLQININYDGRKSEGQPIVNVGRMEARYLF